MKIGDELIPAGSCDVVCLGDGEFDGIQWLETLNQFGWHYACRTAKTVKCYPIFVTCF